MLVLSRKMDQSVELPGLGVVIRVIELKRSRVQLGIEAPKEIEVRRGEKALPEDRRPSAASGSERADGSRTVAGAISSEPGTAASDDWIDELKRMELQLAALAELANAHDRSVARQVAGDAIDRLAAIRRQLMISASHHVGTADARAAAGPLGRFADRWADPQNEPSIAVRQSRGSYRIESDRIPQTLVPQTLHAQESLGVPERMPTSKPVLAGSAA